MAQAPNINDPNTHKIVPNENDVCQDDRTLREREKVLHKQRESAKYTSISETFQFLAGMMLTVGVSLVVNALKEAKKPLLEVLAGETGGLALLAGAATAAAVAITSKYVGAKHLASASFDQTLVNAHQAARSLERKKLYVVQQEYDQNQRADGRSWVSVTRPNMAVQAQAQVQQDQSQPQVQLG